MFIVLYERRLPGIRSAQICCALHTFDTLLEAQEEAKELAEKHKWASVVYEVDEPNFVPPLRLVPNDA